MPWWADFGGKTVLVTGASSGIGRATALAFAAAGARVALVARRRAPLEEVAALAGGDAVVIPTDVTDRAAVRACFDELSARCGAVDVVVNNAGVLLPAPIAEITASDFDAMLRVNVFGALYVMQEAVPRMHERGGSIITWRRSPPASPTRWSIGRAPRRAGSRRRRLAPDPFPCRRPGSSLPPRLFAERRTLHGEGGFRRRCAPGHAP